MKKLEFTPATGVLLSPERQKQLSPKLELKLAKLWTNQPLVAKDTKFLTGLLPVKSKARGGEVQRGHLEKWLKDVLRPKVSHYLGDDTYYLPDEADITEAWSISGLKGRTNVPQRFDCDDFAFAFKGHCSRYVYLRGDLDFSGICVGFVDGEFTWRKDRHAANLFVDCTGGTAAVKFIEPADGKIHHLSECRETYHFFI